jgi:hypothetical protein
VNAAFLLVTSAWLAGQAPPPPAQPIPSPAPAPPMAVASNGCCEPACNNGCGDGCGGGGFLSRLRGLCHRDRCGECGGCAPAPCPKPVCAPCPAPAPCPKPVCAPCPAPCPKPTACCDSGCDSGCGGGGFLSRLRGLCHRNECGGECGGCAPCPAPKPVCAPCPAPCPKPVCAPCPAPCPKPTACCESSCDSGCGGGGFLSRLRKLCHRHDDCCEGGCGTECCGPGYVGANGVVAPGMMPRPEPIKAPKSTEPPKEMPKGSTSGAGIIVPPLGVTPATSFIYGR